MSANPQITIREAHDVQAFWHRIPRFFLFPLQPGALLRILGFAALCGLGAFASSAPSIIVATAGISLIVLIMFLRFASRVLSETSLGRLSMADYSTEPDETLTYLPFKIFGLFLIPGFFVGLIMVLFGSTVGAIANIVVALATPAALMVLVISRSLVAGLNPSAAWSVITAIGKPYLLLCICLYFLMTAETILVSQVLAHMIMPLVSKFTALSMELRQLNPATDEAHAIEIMQELSRLQQQMHSRAFGAIFLVQAVMMYFMLICFNMLGYVLYQFHHALGLDVDEAVTTRSSEGSQPKDPQATQIASLLTEGKITEALDIAYEAQRLEPGDIAAQERYNKLLHLAGKDDRLLNHTQKLIPMLLANDQKNAALEAWRRCRERHATFLPEKADHIVQLAQIARSIREPRVALDLLNGFDRNFRNHPLVPDVYFLCGSILCDDLRKDELADRFFAALCSRYPEHILVPDALRLRDVIAKMRQMTPPKPQS